MDLAEMLPTLPLYGCGHSEPAPGEPFANEPEGIWTGLRLEEPPEVYTYLDQLASLQFLYSIYFSGAGLQQAA